MTGSDLIYIMVKGPFATLWPILLLPVAAALLCDAAAKRLPPTRADWRVAAALAAAPGLLLLALASLALWRIATHFHYDPAWQHLVKYQLTGCLAALIVLRAIGRAWRRQSAIARLIHLSVEPSTRLAAIARRVRVEARALPCDEPECFVAGVLRPTVYVSAGTLQRLSDAELEAALHHEAAHIAGRDTAMLSFLGLLHDLVPVGKAALNAYQQARERSADAAAMQSTGPIALASALLALARGPQLPLPAIGITGTASSVWRLHAILAAEDMPKARPLSIAATLSLMATFAFAGWPTAQQWIINNMCACH